MKPHLTNNELIDQLYGIGDPAAGSHLIECPACTSRYHVFERRRSEAAEASISAADLATQRRAIYSHIDRAAKAQPRWAPALAAGFLLAIGVVLYRPLTRISERPVPVVRTEISDEQLFSEVYSMEEAVEPRAAAPIQGLFEPTVPEAAGEDRP